MGRVEFSLKKYVCVIILLGRNPFVNDLALKTVVEFMLMGEE